MRRGSVSWILLLFGIISTCRADQAALTAVTRGNNMFSAELYDTIRKGNNDNLIVSPLSVATVMGMLQAGARGKTAEAIRSSLHFPADHELNAGYRTLLEQLKSDDSVTLEMANKLFPMKGFSMNPSFVDVLKTYFAAEPQQLDFNQNTEAAGVINNFVLNATRDRIRDLISPDDLNGMTRLVLVNAIYFKGTWKNQFPKEDTKKMPFYTSETDSVEVDMMRLETEMLYGEINELNAKAVSLPYKGERLSMLIILPNERTGLSALEDKLKNYPLEQILSKMRERKVQLYLPKFKLESTIDLKDPLTKLGLANIFDQNEADLTGIAKDSEKLYVSKAVQKAFIEVNEEGSEAAAATGMVVSERIASYPVDLNPVLLKTDHPFLALIFRVNDNNNLIVEADDDDNNDDVVMTEKRDLSGEYFDADKLSHNDLVDDNDKHPEEDDGISYTKLFCLSLSRPNTENNA